MAGRRRWRLVRATSVVVVLTLTGLLLWQVVPGAVAFFHRPLDEQDQQASVLSMLMTSIGLLVSVAGLVVSIRQTRRGRPEGSTAPDMAAGGGRGQRDRAARDRLDAHLGPQGGLRRFGEGTNLALALRVHQAIELPTRHAPPVGDPDDFRSSGWYRRDRATEADPEALDPVLPTWVGREQEPRVRGLLTEARRSGGFLVVVGDSSVGKTRLLYETAGTVLDGWAVIAPALGDGDLLNLTATAGFELPPLVVWLDELHRFLDGPYLAPGSTPITAETVRLLLDRPTPVVILGTMWPEHAQNLRAVDTDPVTHGQRPRHPAALDVLDHRLCRTVTLGGFSARERATAAVLAGSDPRLAAAVADRHFNVTEVLAGAPEIMRRYEQGTPSQQAILHAAVDARRLGVQAPLTIELLAAAARGHPGTVAPDDDWAVAAVRELSRRTGPTDRSTAPLLAIPDPTRRSVVGYDVADYLLQRLTESRRDQRIPAVTWDALLEHVADPDDAARLARSARNRLLRRYAIPLFQRAADAGRASSADDLADLLATPEHLEFLRACADSGDVKARWRLVEVSVARGDVEGLRVSADAGDRDAQWQLAEVLAARGDLAGLRSRADAGDPSAAAELVKVLVGRGDLDGLRARAESGDDRAGRRLAEVLAARGDLDGLRARAGSGDREARWRLVEVLAARGDVEGLRVSADAGDRDAQSLLAEVLAARGDLDGLHVRADAGDRPAARRLAEVLVARGDLEGLRSRADAGDDRAATKLVNVLVARGDLDGLRARAESGDYDARWRLAEVLAARGDRDGLPVRDAPDAAESAEVLVARGDLEGLRSRADAGDDRAATKLVNVLVARGDLDGLRARAESGDHDARWRLAEVLAARGDLDSLCALADAGDRDARSCLAELLVARGDLEGLRSRADTGDDRATAELAKLLVARGDLDELRALADSGGGRAAAELAKVLVARDDLDELRTRADSGDDEARWTLLDVLIARGDAAELRSRVDRGEHRASRHLADVLEQRGDVQGAQQVRQFGLTT
ncbi:hypothetical protein AB0H63_26890 [Micromonospora echinospora]|uniref:hypothetical protein n=1 Tax=Micromonospora echinospora TaxID=1877 RepID=UPI003404807D